jgi:hypothetical protein
MDSYPGVVDESKILDHALLLASRGHANDSINLVKLGLGRLGTPEDEVSMYVRLVERIAHENAPRY